MSNKEIFLSVVIPAYNEEKYIFNTLKSITNYLSTQKYSWEIVVVVNDGSEDNTLDII